MRLEGDDDAIAAKCRALTVELQEWLGRQGPAATEYDGTLASLIGIYQTDEDSPYRGVKGNTRRHYDDTLAIVAAAVGPRRVDLLTRKDFARWHRGFRFPDGEDGPDRVRRAHNCIKMLRIVLRFGASMRYAGCRDAADVLSNMTFPLPAPRRAALTYAQAAAIVEGAIAAGRPSIGLAQALQFELSLRQRDVIGEWASAVETGEKYAKKYSSGIVYHGQRWSGGVLWSDLSADLILTKTTTKTAAVGEWDLKLYPLVMRALAGCGERPATRPENAGVLSTRVGPMIVSETTGHPYRADDYRVKWRAIARAAGVPDAVWNMDSRAGGITEGADAGAAVDDLRRHATHTDAKMTSRYIRGTGPATARVATLRVAKRTKNEA
jgi:hypothetical protein